MTELQKAIDVKGIKRQKTPEPEKKSTWERITNAWNEFYNIAPRIFLTIWVLLAAAGATLGAMKLLECYPNEICFVKGQSITWGLLLTVAMLTEVYIVTINYLIKIHKR